MPRTKAAEVVVSDIASEIAEIEATQPLEAVVADAAVEAEAEFDPSIHDSVHDEARPIELPHGIIVNDSPAGLFIPGDQLDRLNWREIPEQLHTQELSGGAVEGLFFNPLRLIILAIEPESLYYKWDKEVLGEQAGDYISPYQAALHDKTCMDSVSRHIVVLLDKTNQPLHDTPLSIKFKNVALWTFKTEVRTPFYRDLEMAYAKRFGKRYQGKSDQWRAAGVLDVRFKAEKRGEGNKRNWCCIPDSEYEPLFNTAYVKPTAENFASLYLGNPQQLEYINDRYYQTLPVAEMRALPPALDEMMRIASGGNGDAIEAFAEVVQE